MNTWRWRKWLRWSPRTRRSPPRFFAYAIRPFFQERAWWTAFAVESPAWASARVQEIVFACTFCPMLHVKDIVIDPAVFWRHSFGCALICRKFSGLIDFPNPEQAYLAGLLHDIGFQVNALIDPEGWKATIHRAMSTQASLYDVEMAVLGYSHCESGRVLAEQWNYQTSDGSD